MAFIDYYKVLNVSKTATPEQIKAVFRKLARKFHPDLNPNDNQAKAQFQQVNEANEVLSDPEKRKKYDKHGHDWKQAEQSHASRPAGSENRPQSDGPDAGFGSDFSDFFESMFGGSSRGRSNSVKFKGQDFNSELHLSLADAYTTHQQTLSVNGKNIRISIQAGVENGQVIKLAGYGSPGVNGGPAGDLFITFVIPPDSRYKRDGNNLYITQEIDLYTAILGGEVTVETMGGHVRLSVKPESQNGMKVRLKGKGFPVYRSEGQFGDLIITWLITLPVKLTDKQKELFRELSQLKS